MTPVLIGRRWWLPLAIFLTLSGAILLGGSRERPWGDARIMYEVAESMVYDNSVEVKSEWPPMSHRGADGRIFSQYSLGPSVIHVPGIWARRQFDGGHPDRAQLALVVTSHLASAVMAALTCLLFFATCRRLGTSVQVASVSTLALAFATMLLVYARSPYSEALQAATMMAFVFRIAVATAPLGRAPAVWLGIAAGAVLHAKLVFVPSVLFGLGYVAWLHRSDLRHAATTAAFVALGLVPLVGLLLWYNQVRWGSPFETGYDETLALMRENPLSGLWGMFLSPGKSLFLFSPPLVIACLGLPALGRKLGRARGLVLLAMVLWPVLFYSRFLSWSGDYAWGARYLVYLIAPAMLGFAMWLEGARSIRRRVAAAVLIGCGVFVQVLGSSIYWDTHIRMSMRVHAEWLGEPNRQGAAIDPAGRNLCDSCFEDMHGHQWLPPMSPISGHLWLLRHLAADHSYAEASGDAPWRRYTKLELKSPKDIYDHARLDWWGYVFLKDAPGARGLGWALFALFLLMLVGGAAMWTMAYRGAKRGRSSEPNGPEATPSTL